MTLFTTARARTQDPIGSYQAPLGVTLDVEIGAPSFAAAFLRPAPELNGLSLKLEGYIDPP
jgi:hypothetical protein